MSKADACCAKCGAPKTDKTLQTGLCEYCGAILEEIVTKSISKEIY